MFYIYTEKIKSSKQIADLEVNATNMQNKIDELQVVRAEYNRETTRIERKIKELPETIEAKKSLIASAIIVV